MRKCLVPGCGARPCKGGPTLHSFPTDSEMRSKWMTALNISQCVKSACVCEKHFSNDSYGIVFGTKRLKDGAVPSLSPPKDSSPVKNTETENLYVEVDLENALYIAPFNSSTAEVTETYEVLDDFPDISPTKTKTQVHSEPFDSTTEMVQNESSDIEVEFPDLTLDLPQDIEQNMLDNPTSPKSRRKYRYLGDFKSTDVMTPSMECRALFLAKKSITAMKRKIIYLNETKRRMGKKIVKLENSLSNLQGNASYPSSEVSEPSEFLKSEPGVMEDQAGKPPESAGGTMIDALKKQVEIVFAMVPQMNVDFVAPKTGEVPVIVIDSLPEPATPNAPNIPTKTVPSTASTAKSPIKPTSTANAAKNPIKPTSTANAAKNPIKPTSTANAAKNPIKQTSTANAAKNPIKRTSTAKTPKINKDLYYANLAKTVEKNKKILGQKLEHKKQCKSISNIILRNLRNKLFLNSNDKKVMRMYLQLEKSYLRLKKVSSMRQDKLNKLKSHYKATVDKISCLCSTINFVAENMSALGSVSGAEKMENHRWSFQERIHALALFRKSPSSYKILRAMFNLPSEKCLKWSLDKHNSRAGMNKYIFGSLKDLLAKYVPLDRICCLSFDQIELRRYTNFDVLYDKLQGLADIGFMQGRSKVCGDHVVVFELKGLRKKWHLPVAYFFTEGPISSRTLGRVMLRIIAECQQVGATIMCTSCPIKENFVETMNLLESSKERPFIEVQNEWIMTLFDPCHILVLMRDVLYKGNVEMNLLIDNESEVQNACWDHIKLAQKVDSCNSFPKLTKFKAADLVVEQTNKLDVKKAARCLSNSMASVINQQVVTGMFGRETLATAHYTGKINELFDSLNGKSSKPRGVNGLKCRVEKDREQLHMDFWLEASREVESWEFPKDDTWVQSTCIITLRSLLILWAKLRNLGFTSFETRRISNDSLRSFFYGAQAYNKTNNLTFSQFEKAFSNCVIHTLVKMQSNQPITDKYKSFNCPMEGFSKEIFSINFKAEKLFKISHIKVPHKVLKCFSLSHIVQTIGQELLKRVKCDKCLGLIFDAKDDYKDTGFVFESNKDNHSYPTGELVHSVTHCVNEYEKVMQKHMLKDTISYIVPAHLLKSFKGDWLKKGCSTHAKTVTRHIINIVYETVSQWWGRKIAFEPYIVLQEPQSKKRRLPNKPNASLVKRVRRPKLPPVNADLLLNRPLPNQSQPKLVNPTQSNRSTSKVSAESNRSHSKVLSEKLTNRSPAKVSADLNSSHHQVSSEQLLNRHRKNMPLLEFDYESDMEEIVL